MPENKRHHYVPQFLQRLFSNKEKMINVLALNSGKFVVNTPINRQCYKDYFYGKNGELEKLFDENEDQVSVILKRIAMTKAVSLSSDEDLQLKLFILFQKFRTPAEAKITENATAIMKEKFLKEPSTASEAVSKGEFNDESPLFVNLVAASNAIPLMLDLKIKVLIRAESPDFILSDDPVILCNQWADNHPRFSKFSSGIGVASKGLQIFLPITSSACLTLYDSDTYEYGSSSKSSASISAKDVDSLNRLQIISAESCVYIFKDAPTESFIKHILSLRKSLADKFKPNYFEGPVIREEDGRFSQIRGVSQPKPGLEKKFSFVRVIDKSVYANYQSIHFPVRDISLVRESRQLAKNANAMARQKKSRQSQES